MCNATLKRGLVVHHRPREPIEYVPLVEYERTHYRRVKPRKHALPAFRLAPSDQHPLRYSGPPAGKSASAVLTGRWRDRSLRRAPSRR